jgi:tetratricopeptide (TPR) repeat protein
MVQSFYIIYDASNEEDLGQALQLLEHSLALCPPGSFYLRQCYLNLGTAHNLRYSAKKDLLDLERAIELFEQAVALITPEFHSWKAYLTTLAGVLQERFERTENLADLERAKQLRAML